MENKINSQRNTAMGISILSRCGERLSFFQPLCSYLRTCSSSKRQARKEIAARTRRIIPEMLCAAPKTYRKHHRTPKNAAASAENKRTWSPLKNIQYRTRPSSRFISSSQDSSFCSSSDWRKGLLHAAALGVEDFHFAEEGGLRFDLGAVAGEDDLQVGGVEVFAGGREQLFGGNGANLRAIGFEVVVGQFVLRDVRELAQQAILSGEAERKDAAQIVAGVG